MSERISCPLHPPDRHPSAWLWAGDDGIERLVCAHGGGDVGLQTDDGFLILDAIDVEAFRRGISPGRATVELAKELGIRLPGGEPDDRIPPEREEDGPRDDEEEPETGRRSATRLKIPKALRKRAIKLARDGADAATIVADLEKHFANRPRPTPRPVLEKLARWAVETAAADRHEDPLAGLSGEDRTLNDLGNARRLVHRCGSVLLYSKQLGDWFLWDGCRWAEDREGVVAREAHTTVNRLLAEAMAETDPDRQDALAAWWRKSGDTGRIDGMLKQARALVPVLVSKLDADPYLLNVENGTLDLRTGALLPHDPTRLITKLAPVRYEPGATCPLWLRFLDRIFAGNELLIAYMQRLLGYALTGDISEQCVFVFFGTGANGKSTVLSVLRVLMGGYFHDADMSTFSPRQHETDIRADLAALKGQRLVAAVEANEGTKLNESLIKRVTGGEQITCRVPHGKTFSFQPTFKLVLAVNHEPDISGTDEGIWRRIHKIPFTVSIPKAEQDKQLVQKLCAELPGILLWLAEGARRWWADREAGLDGLAVPDAVKAATNDYRDSMDRVGAFIADCCVVDPGGVAASKTLRSAYESWCTANGEQPLSPHAFGHRLREKGFAAVKGARGRRSWRGLMIGSDAGEPASDWR